MRIWHDTEKSGRDLMKSYAMFAKKKKARDFILGALLDDASDAGIEASSRI